jgi:carboxyl-terminal processing protease
MERKNERILWISITILLTFSLVFVIFTPQVFADSGKSDRMLTEYFNDMETAFYYLMNAYVDEVDPDVLFRGAMEGLFASVEDPYTVFLEDMYLQELEDTTQGSFGGVGLYITSERTNDGVENFYLPYVRVVAPIEGTPAYRAGVHSGDYIIEINGESGEGLSSDEVSGLLRGAPNTRVNVTFLQEGEIHFNVDINRAVIEIPTVKYDIIDQNTGYLRIIEFTPYTADRVKEAINYFKDEDCDSIIIDVRNNPGGLLSSVVDICDNFFSSGVIVSTRSRIATENKIYNAHLSTQAPRNWPVVVLIDQGSASASEILTGAMKDRERATIVGQTSFGKGSVQQFIRLGEENAIKLTTARYYTPNDISIDKTGIDPDIFVEEELLSDEQQDSYREVIENHMISRFINENRVPSQEDINNFIVQLKDDGINLEDYHLRMLIQSELYRRMDNPPVFSLEYDKILQRGLQEIQELR